MLRTARAVFFCGIAGRLSTPPQFGKMSSDMQLSLFLSGNSSGIPEKVQTTMNVAVHEAGVWWGHC